MGPELQPGQVRDCNRNGSGTTVAPQKEWQELLALQRASLPLMQLAVPGAAQAPTVLMPGAEGPSSLIPVRGCI